jgi:hypothetical protein
VKVEARFLAGGSRTVDPQHGHLLDHGAPESRVRDVLGSI